MIINVDIETFLLHYQRKIIVTCKERLTVVKSVERFCSFIHEQNLRSEWILENPDGQLVRSLEKLLLNKLQKNLVLLEQEAYEAEEVSRLIVLKGKEINTEQIKICQ